MGLQKLSKNTKVIYGKYMKKRNSTPAHLFAKRRRRKRGKDTKTNKQTNKKIQKIK